MLSINKKPDSDFSTPHKTLLLKPQALHALAGSEDLFDPIHSNKSN
jgi:hypothetical protein